MVTSRSVGLAMSMDQQVIQLKPVISYDVLIQQLLLPKMQHWYSMLKYLITKLNIIEPMQACDQCIVANPWLLLTKEWGKSERQRKAKKDNVTRNFTTVQRTYRSKKAMQVPNNWHTLYCSFPMWWGIAQNDNYTHIAKFIKYDWVHNSFHYLTIANIYHSSS